MTPSLVIAVLIAAAALVLIGFAISALVQLKKTLVNVDTLVVNLNEKLSPLLNDLQDTVKQVNDELGQFDQVVRTVGNIGDKVSTTTRMVHEIVSSPLIRAVSISAGAKEAIKKLVGR